MSRWRSGWEEVSMRIIDEVTTIPEDKLMEILASAGINLLPPSPRELVPIMINRVSWHAEFMDRFAETPGPAIWVVDGEDGCPKVENIIKVFLKVYGESVLVYTYNQRRKHITYEGSERVITYVDFEKRREAYRKVYCSTRLFVIEEYTNINNKNIRDVACIVDYVFENGGIVILFGRISEYSRSIAYYHKKATYIFHVPNLIRHDDSIQLKMDLEHFL